MLTDFQLLSIVNKHLVLIFPSLLDLDMLLVHVFYFPPPLLDLDMLHVLVLADVVHLIKILSEANWSGKMRPEIHFEILLVYINMNIKLT